MNSSQRGNRSYNSSGNMLSPRSDPSASEFGLQRDSRDKDTNSYSNRGRQNSSNDKMMKFIHHTEQQVYHGSKDPMTLMSMSPSRRDGISRSPIYSEPVEYERCKIQTVSDTSKNRHNSDISEYHNISSIGSEKGSGFHHSTHISDTSIPSSFLLGNTFSRSRSHGMSIELRNDARNASRTVDSIPVHHPMFSKGIKKSLHRSMLNVDDKDDQSDDDQSNSQRKKGRKKKNRFGIRIFGKKNRKNNYHSMSSDDDDYTSKTSESDNSNNVLNETPERKFNYSDEIMSIPSQSVHKLQNERELHENDLIIIRQDVTKQKRNIAEMQTTIAYLRKEITTGDSKHAKICGELERSADAYHQEIDASREDLMVEKVEKNEQLIASLLTKFRNTVENSIKDVQKRINICNNRKKAVIESNVTPFQDFYSRLLAYSVAGVTIVGSVFICTFFLNSNNYRFLHIFTIIIRFNG